MRLGLFLVFVLHALSRILEYACDVRKDFPVIELRIAFETDTLQHVAIFRNNAHIACSSDQIIRTSNDKTYLRIGDKTKEIPVPY